MSSTQKMEFLENKYATWYFNIIKNAKNRLIVDVYTEKHHIIPKSLGGNNSKDNLVILTAREHFICHLLLTKMVLGDHKKKMIFAFVAMSRFSSNQERYKINSRMFEKIKKNKKHTEEAKNKISQSHKGLKQSEETIEKRSSKLRGKKSSLKGRLIHNEASKNKISEELKKTLKNFSEDKMKDRMLNSCCASEVYTKERADKISASHKGKKLTKQHKENIGKVNKGTKWYNNGIIQIHIKGNPPEGFIHGMLKGKKI